jgi:membrane protein implicated in regulation of membrane protease activity
MPQIILLLIVALIAWIGYRKFIADAEKLTRQRDRLRRERETGADGTLIKDPKTGEYRLKRDDE